jgi:CubicO group peptidase (beta-lactamase class C family)
MTKYRLRIFATLCAILCLAMPTVAGALGAKAALPIPPAKIDDIVARAMKAFNVPGMAVGIVKDGQLIYAKGYGVREFGKPATVDPNTLFQIGSNTKAFTAAALAILVDEGKIHWDDKVIDYLPDFRLYDPYVTREFTIRDLLTHRSGLGTGAGDLMFYPTTDFTRAEIIHGLRYLKPVSSFRSQYGYDNSLYMVAGQIIPAVTGQSWEDFVEKRILEPLKMQPCAASYGRIRNRSDVAAPHVVINGKLTPIDVENIDVIGPAGTINCNINGMAKWLEVQLAAGKMPDGRQLFSPERTADMWAMNTIVPLDPVVASVTGTHFKGYGLGWELEDEFGYKRVSHTGGVLGSETWVCMIPELNLGILVFTNQENGYAMEAVGNQILDAYVRAPKRDLVSLLQTLEHHKTGNKSVEENVARAASIAGPPTLPLSAYVGTYTDPWRGNATVILEDGHLVLKISRTKHLTGTLSPYSGNIFLVRWNDRSLHADAFVQFDETVRRDIGGMTMRAISPQTDLSFDFQDLHFAKGPGAETSY